MTQYTTKVSKETRKLLFYVQDPDCARNDNDKRLNDVFGLGNYVDLSVNDNEELENNYNKVGSYPSLFLSQVILSDHFILI